MCVCCVVLITDIGFRLILPFSFSPSSPGKAVGCFEGEGRECCRERIADRYHKTHLVSLLFVLFTSLLIILFLFFLINQIYFLYGTYLCHNHILLFNILQFFTYFSLSFPHISRIVLSTCNPPVLF